MKSDEHILKNGDDLLEKIFEEITTGLRLYEKEPEFIIVNKYNFRMLQKHHILSGNNVLYNYPRTVNKCSLFGYQLILRGYDSDPDYDIIFEPFYCKKCGKGYSEKTISDHEETCEFNGEFQDNTDHISNFPFYL